MARKLYRGQSVIVKVLPDEVKQLHDEEVFIVNRVRLNSRLVSLEMHNTNSCNQEHISIIRKAIGGMLIQEKKKRCVMPGATMVVKDVKKVFPNVETMPKNSFAKITV